MPSRVYLRGPTTDDERAFLAAVQRSQTLHRPWVAPPRTPHAFDALLRKMEEPANSCRLVIERETDELAGEIDITNIVRGVFRSGYLGYNAFAGFEGRGLMREGLQIMVRHAFGALKLHRLEANIQPGNAPSIALVRACGFSKEGYSPRYLKIGGRWRDHERWARVA